jgi:hypothetical protein
MTRLRTDNLPPHILTLAPERWGRITVDRMNQISCEAQLAFAVSDTYRVTIDEANRQVRNWLCARGLDY